MGKGVQIREKSAKRVKEENIGVDVTLTYVSVSENFGGKIFIVSLKNSAMIMV